MEYINRQGTKELDNLGLSFDFPKPSSLIAQLIKYLDRKKDIIVLDSFAGSGPTAQAVLNLNSSDKYNRKFILVEMMDYAESLTAERVNGLLTDSIIFLVLYPNKRNQQRVFWKYLSSRFIASIDFNNGSAVIDFTSDDEIENTDESVNKFVKKLDFIADTHSYMKRLEAREYTAEDVIKLVTARCENISEAIETGVILNSSRDKISRRILTELEDLCNGTLMLNGLRYYKTINLRVAWELALTSIDTKFLSTFSQGLKYIGLRVPEDGQYERLMLKYYDFCGKSENICKTFTT